MTLDIQKETSPILEYDGNMLGIELRDNGRTARLHLTPDGKEMLMEHCRFSGEVADGDEKPDDLEWLRDYYVLWTDLFDDIQGNSDIRLLDNDLWRSQIGALTEAPMFAFGVDIGDNGDLDRIGDTYWFPNYMVEDELASLMFDGFLDFTRAD